jgi:hypothetical protein
MHPNPCLKHNPLPHPEQVSMAGGKAASSKGPALHLIPTVALEKIADRFELGIIRKGDKSWNAISNNQECMDDVPFLIERCSHIIHHALKLRDQLARGVQPGEESPTDNATAIGWGAIFLTCAVERMQTPAAVVTAKKVELDPVPRMQLTAGKDYHCCNGVRTGILIKMAGINTYYAGTIPDVIWSEDGVAAAVNRDLTDQTLRGYTISHETF